MKERRKEDRRKRNLPVEHERRKGERRKTPDRRRQNRVPIEMWMEEVGVDEVYFRHTGNVSEGGVFFENALPHPIGTILTLSFRVPDYDQALKVRAQVTNVDTAGAGMGLEFLFFEGEGQKLLNQFIADYRKKL